MLPALAVCLSLMSGAPALAGSAAKCHAIKTPTTRQLKDLIASHTQPLKYVSMKTVSSARFRAQLARAHKITICKPGIDHGTIAYIAGNNVFVLEETFAGPMWKKGSLRGLVAL